MINASNSFVLVWANRSLAWGKKKESNPRRNDIISFEKVTTNAHGLHVH